MTTGAHPDHGGPDLFVADFYPRLGEYLAKLHANGYDAAEARAQFLFWLAKHVAGDEPAELSAEDEAALAARIKAGRGADQELATSGTVLSGDVRSGLEWVARDGQSARNELLAHNRRLVASVAERFSDRGVPLVDLVQAGTLGLERAVEKFDHTRGYRFPTYATWWIRRAITRAIADRGDVVKEDSPQ